MKKHLLSLGIFLLAGFSALAQNRQPFKDTQLLKSFSLGVSYAKTVNLIFPSGVHSVDLGSAAVIADKFAGVENVLRVKANAKGFPETNLSVITKDGRLYSFHVRYQEEPTSLTYQIEGGDHTGITNPLVQSQSKVAPAVYLTASLNTAAPVSFESVLMNEAELAYYSHEIAERRDYISGIGMHKNKITFGVDGIYVKDNVLFFPITAKNKGNLNYDIDFIKFYVRDKKQRKRTAVQETEVTPIFVYPEGQNTITGRSELKRVYCLEKFTIPDKKMLVVEMYEKNGGRVMTMEVGNRDIVRASPVHFNKRQSAANVNALKQYGEDR
ncbi:conjugative transposon protein TraN [Rufibacter latericius]|uniref:Conjugative transposon protein TraN n=1 Tax=Rufibacter latericius TaxID=2487040 RepID=A0A3M9MHH5_9BACT|nr:conjugative transposon protein TraN [Rufibacter latericius]RNI24118.1 conjugative transposon protein TraN [Rufibacter latericius]